MALYWTSGSDWNLAAGGSHWSLIGDLDLKIQQQEEVDRQAADSSSSPEAEPPAPEDTPDDLSPHGWGRR